MKKIINGKKYDTETAKELASADASCPVNDFHYWEETLYKKKTGEFFLAGWGGPATKYAVAVDRTGRTGGEKIFPLSDVEAREWVEQHANDDFENIFGECEE